MKKLLLFVFAFVQIASFAQGTCLTALPVTSGTYTYGVINGAYEAGCWATGGANGLWYSFTSPVAVQVRINTNIAANPATGDSRVSVFTGVCGILECYAGSDDVDDTNYLTDFTFIADAATTYYIVFDNRWGPDANNLTFEVSVETPTCTDAIPFNETWDSALNFLCWTSESADALVWSYNNGNDFDGDAIDDPVALVFPSETNNAPKDDWLISKGLTMASGTTYEISVTYNGFNNPLDANESFDTVILNAADSGASFNQIIGSAGGIVQTGTLETLLPSATTSTYTFSPATSGVYHVGLHANTAAAAGILVVFNVSVTAQLSTQDFFASNLKIYPNPTKDILNLSSSTTLINSVEVTDLNGRIVKSFNLNGISQTELNVSSLQSGMYFVSVQTELGKGTTKIVKN